MATLSRALPQVLRIDGEPLQIIQAPHGGRMTAVCASPSGARICAVEGGDSPTHLGIVARGDGSENEGAAQLFIFRTRRDRVQVEGSWLQNTVPSEDALQQAEDSDEEE